VYKNNGGTPRVCVECGEVYPLFLLAPIGPKSVFLFAMLFSQSAV